MLQNTNPNVPIMHLCPHGHAWYSRGILNLLGLFFLLPVVAWQVFLVYQGRGSIFLDPVVLKILITFGFSLVLDLITGFLQHKRTYAEGDFLFFPLLAVLSLPTILPLPTVLAAILFGNFLTKWVFHHKATLVPFVSSVYAYGYFAQPDAFQSVPMTNFSPYVTDFLTRYGLDHPDLFWLTNMPGCTLNTFLVGYIVVALFLYLFQVIDFRIPIAATSTYLTLLLIWGKFDTLFTYPATIFALLIVSGDTRVSPFSNLGKWIFGIVIGLIAVGLQLGWKANIAGYFAILMASLFAPIIDSLLRPILLKQVKKTYEVLL